MHWRKKRKGTCNTWARGNHAITRCVQKEELSPRYIELDQYLSYYDEETARTKLSVFKTDASKLGLSYYAEDALISSKYAQWKNLLNE